MNHRVHRSEAGFTLIELIVSLTILATITGAITATFLTANNANANVSERLHESNDAQITSGFWTADAQAAGGVNPALGATDATLGVSASDDGSCGLAGGAPVFSFKWKEWASRVTSPTVLDSYTTRVANYVFRAGTAELERRTCSDAATPGTLVSTGVVTLATRVASAPTVTCDAAACPGTPRGLPRVVQIGVTETNSPVTSTSGPYQFTLSATVRPTGQTAPSGSNAAGSPLLALGSNTCVGSTTGISVGGTSDVTVNGQAAVNAADVGGCHALVVGGNFFYSSDGTSLIAGGTCVANGSKPCPPTTTDASAIGDPFASLAPPVASCAGTGNPAAGNPGIYRSPATLTGTLAAGTYVFCNTLTFSGNVTGTDVFLYFKGVGGISITGGVSLNISAPRTGTYEGLLLWNDTSTAMTIGGNSGANVYAGTIYSPQADVTVAGTADIYIGSIIAKRILFTGTGKTFVTNGSATPGGPPLTAATSTNTTRGVNLAWTAPAYTGTPGNPILGYEYRADTGSGFGAWTIVPGGLVTTFTHNCGTRNTAAANCTYEVRALNALGAGSASNAAGAPSMFDTTAPAITTPATGSVAGTTSTFLGSKWNGPGDATTVTVRVFAGATCTGSPEATFVSGVSAGLTWSATSPALTNGVKCAQATQIDFAGASVNGGAVNFTVGKVKRVVLGNANGLVAKGDTVTIEFAQAMTEATICSTWSGTGDQAINGNSQVTVTITNGGIGNDVLTVTSNACILNVGTIDLGSPNWVTANTSFSGSGGSKSTLGYAGSANALTPNTLTITLGAVSAGAGNIVVVPALTVVYTPAAALRDALNASLPGTYAFTGQRF